MKLKKRPSKRSAKAKTTAIVGSTATIKDVVEFLAGKKWTPELDRKILSWPPDAFAVAATLLRECGAYLAVAHTWPTKEFGTQAVWVKRMQDNGLEWLKLAASNLPKPPEPKTLKKTDAAILLEECPAKALCPKSVLGYWDCVRDHMDKPLVSLERESCEIEDCSRPLTTALVAIVASADEACFGVGAMPWLAVKKIESDLFDAREKLQFAAAFKLQRDVEDKQPATLGMAILRHAAIVLPKTRTPQTGMTIRSLTHNLALLRGGEVRTDWVAVLSKSPDTIIEEQHCLTLLLVPWPTEVLPSQFQAVPSEGTEPYHGSSTVRSFKFSHDKEQSLDKANVNQLLKNAVRQIGRVDGVVFPELSITEAEFDDVSKSVREGVSRNRSADSPAGFVLAGVYRDGGAKGFGVNKVIFEHNVGEVQAHRGSVEDSYKREQHKHHRWHLDEGQIRQYGLGAQLDPRRLWIEHIRLAERTVEFVNLDNRLLMSTLICEDLAQSDPIADAIRAVGPNLVICLLADGPQLTNRWPSRYATTLADDPGCSVLTLTSLGMARLSQPRNGERSRQQVIALWKEARGSAREIVLEEGCDAVALSLSIHFEEQLTADHRPDGKTTRGVTLSGVRQIYSKSR